jgi:predicted nuclease of restriction endonuclease-like RecB superfamily
MRFKYLNLLTKDFLLEEYINNRKSTYMIAKEVGVHNSTIREYLLINNIKIRNCSEMQIGEFNHNYKEQPKKYCIDCNKLLSRKAYYSGYERCNSCATKKQLKNPRNHPMFGKLAANGKGEYYKDIYMRSSYEIAYAKYLDRNNVKWEYEPKTFDLGNATYRPDFYLLKSKSYIEIKGWWRGNAREKFELFKTKYPEIGITLLMKEDLKRLGVL